MFQIFRGWPGHYLLILAVVTVPNLANLGRPSLWDIDEGKNSEAAREMLESGNWVIPTFNYQPRYEKPALLYWLQIGAYVLFGVNEFAARLPSALACCLTALLAYEIGRSMFDRGTGLLAGLILSSMAFFCASAHFANPDALLNLFVALTLTLCWMGIANRQAAWLLPAGISAGLGVLAKGPVALVLPSIVVLVFLIWSRQLRFLRARALLGGTLAFLVTVLPWYVWVAVDTKGAFLRAFFLKENIERFLNPMEHHSGPIFYYCGFLLVGAAPWSVFLGLAAWYSFGGNGSKVHAAPSRRRRPSSAYQFLWSWVLVYLVFFSLARTKLPNYVLPSYLPLAILLARFLEHWRIGALRPRPWAVSLCFGFLLFIGLATSLSLLMVGGVITFPGLQHNVLPGMGIWGWAGIIPIVGAGAGWWFWYKSRLAGMLTSLTATAVLFIAVIATGASLSLDLHKAPRGLVEAAHARDEDHDIRVGSYQYFQPSLVFYCRREVQVLDSEQGALEFLRYPLQVFLFVPWEVWEKMKADVAVPVRLLARHEDLYRHCEVVVVTNR